MTAVFFTLMFMFMAFVSLTERNIGAMIVSLMAFIATLALGAQMNDLKRAYGRQADQIQAMATEVDTGSSPYVNVQCDEPQVEYVEVPSPPQVIREDFLLTCKESCAPHSVRQADKVPYSDGIWRYTCECTFP